MALLEGEMYEAYRAELLKQYRHLLRTLGKDLSKEKVKLVHEAFDLAARAHEGTVRKSGEPYIFHPLAVAQIAAGELGLGATSVVAALLHDTVEDTDITLEDIEYRFGPKISAIINGLTKISTVFDSVDRDTSSQAENFKKVLLTLGEDLRVILIKLCDRLHNMRTLGSVPESTKLKIASETMFIYAPLADRLGLNAVKLELEDLALKFTDPDTYKDISRQLVETKRVRQKYIREFIEPLKGELEGSGVNIVEIKGRPKSIYSIHRKMLRQQIPFEEVYDAFAIRIIIDSPLNLEKADCWRVYAIVTDRYRSHDKRLRDWLSHPKSNGYSALHTTVLGPKGKWVEVQIRSKRMDDVAERGLAAHWRYKADLPGAPITPQDQAFENWLNTVKDTLANSDMSALDLVSEFRNTILGEEMYVFTPKGDVKSLPVGSTALDFGFAIHSQVGLRTIGAKVNGKLVPISQELRNGDIVEIITTAKDRATTDWMNQVKTGRAKGKIRDYLKAQRNRLSVQGKEIMERLLRKHRFELSESSAQKLTRHFGYLNPAEFYHAAASGIIKINKALLISILTKTPVTELAENSEKIVPSAEQKVKKAPKQQIIIGDDHDFPYELAKCCHPLPGDSIFGFITIGEGVKIHRTTCPNATNLMSQYGYRIIPAKWKDESYDKSFAARIQVNGIDDVGLVSRLTEIISRDMAVNMKSIHIESDGKGSFSGWIEVMINNLNHLTLLIQNMKEAHKYIEVKRLDEA